MLLKVFHYLTVYKTNIKATNVNRT